MNDFPDSPQDPDADASARAARWDSVELTRRRAAKARAQRDASIAELRASLTDEDARDDFGIHLGEIEK